MNGQREARLWESCVQTIGQHGLSALNNLLGRLRDHDQRTAPLLFVRRHPFSGADPRSHMQVVTAGVHHRRSFWRTHFAGEWESCLLLHR